MPTTSSKYFMYSKNRHHELFPNVIIPNAVIPDVIIPNVIIPNIIILNVIIPNPENGENPEFFGIIFGIWGKWLSIVILS
jgi:hypothetical protein